MDLIACINRPPQENTRNLHRRKTLNIVQSLRPIRQNGLMYVEGGLESPARLLGFFAARIQRSARGPMTLQSGLRRSAFGLPTPRGSGTDPILAEESERYSRCCVEASTAKTPERSTDTGKFEDSRAAESSLRLVHRDQ